MNAQDRCVRGGGDYRLLNARRRLSSPWFQHRLDSSTPAPAPAPKPAGTNDANGTVVRAARAAPIHRGEPGYSSRLDRAVTGLRANRSLPPDLPL
ncbi:excalibur calcium-binding domain-containing protein [Nocardiaceae bacterium NPDC056970]